MKKIFSLIIALAAMFTMTMTAQTLEQPKFFDNTYLRIEGGATALTHPHALGYEDWSHTIQGVVAAEIGKWVTPNFGVAFEGDFGIRNGSKFGYFQYEYIDFETLDAQKSKAFNYITVAGLVKLNVSNIIAGYNPARKWEFVLATGPMWLHAFPGKNYENDFGVKFKAELNYNLNTRWQFNIVPELNYNLTGLYSYGTWEHPRFDSRNSWYGLKLGVTYKLGKQFKVCDKRYTQADIDRLNAELNSLRARQPQTVEVERVVEKVVVNNVQTTYVVAFDYGKAELDDTAKAVLNNVPVDAVVDVKGEASYPGSTEFNKKLSEERAKVVAEYLAARRVKVATAEGLGETGHQTVTVVVK